MRRSEVINRVARTIRAKTYLEIGVESGKTYKEVEIAAKHGVDPNLLVPHSELDGAFFSMTSDEFFTSIAGTRTAFDVIFIDGLHTFEQSLQDFLNAMNHLSPVGVILLDDVRPTDEFAALRDHGRCRALREKLGFPDTKWMGDVFKTVAFINDFIPSFSFATTDDESAVCVCWKPSVEVKRAKVFGDIKRIAEMDYVDFLEQDQMLQKAGLDRIVQMISETAQS